MLWILDRRKACGTNTSLRTSKKKKKEKNLQFSSPSWKRASEVVAVVKNAPANAGDLRDACSIPGLGRLPGEGHGNPLQCSCLENPMDRGAWQATIHRVAKSWTQLSD